MERSRSASTCTASSRTPRFLVLSGTRQEAGDTGETVRRLAHLHERGRGADSIVDKASGGCSAAASRRRGLAPPRPGAARHEPAGAARRRLVLQAQIDLIPKPEEETRGRRSGEERGGKKKIRQGINGWCGLSAGRGER